MYLYVLMALQLSVSASRVARIGHEDSPGHLLRASRRSSSHLLFRKAIDEMMSRSCLCCHRTCGEDVGYAARVSLLVAVPLNVRLPKQHVPSKYDARCMSLPSALDDEVRSLRLTAECKLPRTRSPVYA